METEQEEIERYIQAFKRTFKRKFGHECSVRYIVKQKPILPLEIIADSADSILNTLTNEYYENGIRTIYHDDNVLLCRWCYYKLAQENGHIKSRSAKFIKQSGPSVGYGLGKITQLIKEDGKEKQIYDKIKSLIEDTILRSI